MEKSLTGAAWPKLLTDKRILVTGHTGFKGAWLSSWLNFLGAKVYGLALPPTPEQKALFTAVQPQRTFASQSFGDVRDHGFLNAEINGIQPQIIFHLAAQPLVRTSYREPRETFETNVMGTVNVLDAARHCRSLRAIVVVTSDKCYENREQVWPYRETDPVGGHDPYSASKGACEIVTASFAKSFYSRKGTASCASGRAGNVIGGGDFSEDRIVPDFVRAVRDKTVLEVRNPGATRPWQHVLEPLNGYIKLAAGLLTDRDRYSGAWNFGPRSESNKTVGDLVGELRKWSGEQAVKVRFGNAGGPHEAKFLKLDISKAEAELAWEPKLKFAEAVKWTMDWYLAYLSNPESAAAIIQAQIENYSAKSMVP